MEKQIMDKSCKEFLAILASKEPAPGGGAAAAITGATAAALISMVANLTLGKTKFAAVEEEIHPILVTAELLRSRMTALATADAAVFTKFMEAYRLPKNTEAEKAQRAESIQIAAYDAAEVPLNIADSCLEVLQLAAKIIVIGNPNVITDATVAALLARAALRSASFNVRSNLNLLQDRDYISKTEGYLEELWQKAEALEELVVTETNKTMS